MKDSKGSKYDSDKMPKHIAIIMDGNGRWAERKHMPRTLGHRAGMNVLRNVVETCVEINLPVLTVFAFSTENWRRPPQEVQYLMNLLIEFLGKELKEMHKNNIRIQILGDYLSLPANCIKIIEDAVDLTKENTQMVFNIALNYGARYEILEAVKRVGRQLLDQTLDIEDINEELFSNLLFTGNLPDPDLLIRTAGEMRISNFLLWQIAYTELWITDVAWPQFTKNHLMQAIQAYCLRDRRFGGLKGTVQE